jgi:eukaryotic-like serine/threonine-protein kinase
MLASMPPSSDDGTVGDDSRVSTAPEREPVSLDELTVKGGTIGRYTILERVGSGAAGVVYSAYDPELDRRVALKVMRKQARRSRREAHAMARLAHANVVTIYDVGEHDGRMFLAMEFADGGTLADWLHRPRPWREVLDVFVRAGKGLDAVHRAGLVHRDFKPANVLLFKSGDVRVSDFGLARAAGDAEAAEPTPLPHDVSLTETLPAPASTPAPSPSLRDRVTRPGDLLGTPLYMAPEQHRGEGASALSDQFAFSVALFEALYGDVPFAGNSRQAMLEAMEAPPRFPSRTPVPGWVRRAVARGLAVRPEDRHPSMGAMLGALGPRRRSAWIAVAALGALAAGATVVAGIGLGGAPALDPCATPQVSAGDVWNPTRKAEVTQSLLGTGAAFAPAAAAAVSARLDHWAAQLVSVEHEVCRARAPGYDAQLACLVENRAEVATLVELFRQADLDLVGRAVAVVQRLPAPQSCVQASRDFGSRNPALAKTARHAFAISRALSRSGRMPESLAIAALAVAQASAAGDEQTAVRAAAKIGGLAMRVDPNRALRLLEETLWRALALGSDMDSVVVLSNLVNVCNRLERYPEAERYGRRAADLLSRTPDELARAELLTLLGATYRKDGRVAEAEAPLLEALAIRSRLLPPNDLDIASSHFGLGNFYSVSTRYPEARDHYLEALAIRVEAFGEQHSVVASTLTNLGTTAYGLGDYEEAREYHQRSLAIQRQTLPLDAVEIAIAEYNLAGVLYQLERYDEALAAYEASRLIYAKRMGEESSDVGDILADVADVKARQGRIDEALAGYAHALRVFAKAEPDVRDVRIAGVRLRRAQTYSELGRHAEALADAQAARVKLQITSGPDHLDVAAAWRVIGEAHLELGHTAQALGPLERAVAIREAHAGDPADLARVRFALARAVDGNDPARALDLATRALGDTSARDKPAIEAWLAARR